MSCLTQEDIDQVLLEGERYRWRLPDCDWVNCFVCGEPGDRVRSYLRDMRCNNCEVEWRIPGPDWPFNDTRETWDKSLEDRSNRQKEWFHVDEYIDFSKEGAPSCP